MVEFNLTEEIEKLTKKSVADFDVELKKLIQLLDNLCYEYDEHSAEEHYGEKLYQNSKEEIQKEIDKMRTLINRTKEISKSTKGKYALKAKWDKCFGNNIFLQPEYSSFFFHFTMGAIFFHDFSISYNKVRNDDIRKHIGIIGPTGIGKTEANNFCLKIASKIPKRIYVNAEGEEIVENFVAHMAGKTTDTGLIGTLDTDTYVKQIEKGIKQFIQQDGQMVPNPRWVDPVIKGSFWRDDLLYIDEAEQVFKANKDSEQLQQIFRRAMNRYGEGGNELSNDASKCKGLVKYHSSTSISMTSFFIKEFNKTYFEGGLMQRMLVFIDYEDREKRQKIADKIAESVINYCEDESSEEYKKFLEKKEKQNQENIIEEKELTEEIIELKKEFMTYKPDWKPEYRIPMLISQDVSDRASQLINEALEIPLTVSQQEYLETQRTRLYGIILKCATDYAIIEKRKVFWEDGSFRGLKMTREDIDFAYKNVILPQSNSVADFLRINLKQTEVDKGFEEAKQKLIQCLRKYGGGITKTELNSLLKKPEYWGMSEAWNISMLKKMEERNVIEVVKTGNKNERMVRLVNLKKQKQEKPSWMLEDDPKPIE